MQTEKIKPAHDKLEPGKGFWTNRYNFSEKVRLVGGSCNGHVVGPGEWRFGKYTTVTDATKAARGWMKRVKNEPSFRTLSYIGPMWVDE